jgi:plasmid stabilization system protein ParE
LERLLQQAQEQQRAAYEQKLSEQITKFAEGKNYGADRERIVRKSLRFFLACLFYLLPSSALLA